MSGLAGARAAQHGRGLKHAPQQRDFPEPRRRESTTAGLRLLWYIPSSNPAARPPAPDTFRASLFRSFRQFFDLSFAHALDRLFDAALSLVYPRGCEVCGVRSVESRADGPACAECWGTTHVFNGGETLCWKCGAPAAASVPEEVWPRVRCRRCDAEGFDAARACGPYEGALRAAVLSLKREPFVPARLARLLGETAARPPLDAATLVVPVPLHAERERERGFNQAALLARAAAVRRGLRLDEWSLTRAARSERHRAGMDARAPRERRRRLRRPAPTARTRRAHPARGRRVHDGRDRLGLRRRPQGRWRGGSLRAHGRARRMKNFPPLTSGCPCFRRPCSPRSRPPRLAGARGLSVAQSRWRRVAL